MSLLRMAARNLRRAPRRTALTVAAGAGGLCVAVMIANLARGIYDQAVGDAVRMGPGHLSVHHAGHLPLRDAARDFPGEELAASLAALPGVESVRPRFFLPSLAESEAGTRAATLIGVDPVREALRNPLARRVAAGSFLSPEAPDGVLISARLASALQVGPGDSLRLVTPGRGVATSQKSVRVLGILAAGLDELDAAAIFVPLDLAQTLAGRPGMVHELAVLLRSSGRTAMLRTRGDLARRAAGAAEDLFVSTWEEALPELRDAVALDVLSHRLILLAVFAIAGIGVAATLVISVLERTRELGLLAALGSPPAFLRRLVLAEGALLGTLATALGLALGAAATAALAHWGLDARPFFRDEIAFGGALFSLRLHAAWDWGETARAAAVLWAVHLLAAAGPARRAAAVRPAEAMRFR